MKDLFLPFRCFCTRKDIQCKDVVLDDHDVAKSIVEFAAHAAIEKLVVGATARGGFVRFKAEISSTISKTAPDFCTVYVVTKGGKVNSVRQAIRQAPAVSPLRTMIQGPKPDQVHAPAAAAAQKWTPPPPSRGDVAATPMMQDNPIMSPFARSTGRGAGSARKPFPEFSLPESSDISFIGSAPRRSTERYPPCPPRLSSGSEGLDQHSFEARTPSRWGDSFGNDSTAHSQTSTSSWCSQPTDDMEAEMKRLRLELKQTMDMYSTACKEALSAKQKAMELQRWKVEEEQRSHETRLTEESAMALIEQEKAKARAAIEAAEAAQRLADLEAQKRIGAEMKALKEAEERLRSVGGGARESRGTFADLLDPAVHDWPMEEAHRFAEVSLRCCELRRKDRPDLATVVLPELNRLRALGEDNMEYWDPMSGRGGMHSSSAFHSGPYSNPRHDGVSDPSLGRPHQQHSSNGSQAAMPTRRLNYN
ncbi:U-box domain-containing protein 35-like [Panicum miliaceum]|uniref:RING-type E3 ubiquitin transferase n=1 Tax=Panicum miliaceum TaxID=4540 RepID=A0A3L6QIG4_PANMI|nr:U-box domain-containing protein 35-like [Panicum miliaceum]